MIKRLWLVGVIGVVFHLSCGAGAEESGRPGAPGRASGASEVTAPGFIDIPPAPGEDLVVKQVLQRFPHVEVEGMMDFIRETMPYELYQYRKLCMGDLDRAADYLTTLVGDAAELRALKMQDRAAFERAMERRTLERRAVALVDALRSAGKEVRPGLEVQLQLLLEQLFRIKQEQMRADIKKLEAEIVELKKLVERREEQRKAIVSRRLSQLAGDGRQLAW